MASFDHQQPQMMMKMINSSFDNMVDDGGDEFFDLKPFSCEIYTPLISSSCISDINNGTNWSSLQTVSELSNHHHQQKSAFCSSSGPQVISFGRSSNSFVQPADYSDNLLLDDDMVCNKPKSVTRSPLQAQYHVEAERKRREKLSELFISLSKIIPGLKKLDKATLLGDAIKYMKELQERVKILEEETNRRNSMSMEFDDAMRTNNSTNSNVSGCSYNSLSSSNITNNNSNTGTCRREVDPIHEVRVRVMNNNLLIKFHCEKRNNNGSFVARIPREMEKLNLSILDIRVIPFGCSILDITILAQMDREYPPTVKDIIKHLQQIDILNPEDQTLMSNNYSFSEDCFHHLSPLSGSEEVWEE